MLHDHVFHENAQLGKLKLLVVTPNILSYKTYVRQIAGMITGTVELGLEVLASENHSLLHCSVSLLRARLQFSLS